MKRTTSSNAGKRAKAGRSYPQFVCAKTVPVTGNKTMCGKAICANPIAHSATRKA